MKVGGQIELRKLINDWSWGETWFMVPVDWGASQWGLELLGVICNYTNILRMVHFISDTIRSLYCWYTG